MDEALNLSQQQRLQQRLSPLQVMFGRMLEMSVPEFEEEVQRMLDENPALERADDSNSAGDDFNETAEEVMLADYKDEDEIPAYRLEAKYHNEGEQRSRPVAADESDTGIASLETQLADSQLTDSERDIARYIIGSLDDNGYLTRSPAAIASDIRIATGMTVSVSDVEKVLETVRSFDPPGIGATDLRDCLLLQLDRRERTVESRTATEIVRDYFDLFAKKHYDRIRNALEISPEAMDAAVELIRSLNPKPGGSLERVTSADRLNHIIPDAAVEVSDDGHRASVTLLGNVPELCVEESFRVDDEPVPENRRQQEAYFFRKARYEEADNFIKIIQRRSSTLLSTIKTIVQRQMPFFVTGDPARIKPMVLRDIADATGLDVSVVSRATTGKYVLTRHGIYPLKMFFNERVAEGSEASSHEIAAAVASIINKEDKQHPLSDEALTREMIKAGYDVARRTVAKYRERLGLPVARLRRAAQ